MTTLQRALTTRRLMGGIPAFILATALLPSHALAQTHQVDSEGRVTVTTVQRSQGAGITAITLAPLTTVNPDTLEDSSIRVAGNNLGASATVNAATATLAPDTRVPSLWPSRATIQTDAVDAEGAVLILGGQALSRSPVVAEISGSAASFVTGTIEGSQVGIDSNIERADARGNDHLATLSVLGSGGGIALSQNAETSQIRAAQSGVTTLLSGETTGSALTIARNRQQASAITNSADSSLSASGVVSQSADGVPTTSVDAMATLVANASEFVAQRQVTTGPTVASAGSTLRSGQLIYTGPLTASALSVEENALEANATANQAASAVALDVSPVTGFGNIAASLTAQKLDGQVISGTVGRSQVHVAGAVSASGVVLSGNSVRGGASGNVADTDLRITAPAIVTGGLPTGPVGTALVSGDETRMTTAALAAHADQQIGRVAILATATHSGAVVGVDGPTLASSIVASDNLQGAFASGNGATTGLSVSAPVFASTADLLSSQTSEADVSTAIGDPDDPAGVTLALGASVADSQLRITGDSVQTVAVGNRSANTLALDTASASDGGGHLQSRAGTLDDGYGAAATLALSSVQKVGMLGALPAISSLANGRFAVTGNGDVSASAVVIDGNRQSAGALANTGENTLALSGTTLGNAGTALSSSQFGGATLGAASSVRIVAPGTTERSTVSITGNINQSTAALNEATNRLTVYAALPSDPPLASVSSDTLGGAASEGSNLLNSAQFAMGRATATTRTMLAGSIDAAVPGLNGSSFRINGNGSSAEASGNRAANSVDLHGAAGGIASSQMNTAEVGASTQTDIFLGHPDPDQRTDASSVAIDTNRVAALARGNLVENSLSVDGLPNFEVTRTQVSSYRTRALAPTAIASNQSNYGGVSAVVSGSGLSVPLNGGTAPASDSRISSSGNSISATAYGNGAVNSMTLAPARSASGVALVSSQYNYGPLQARVTGSAPNFAAGDVRGSSLSITNNSVTATATGNVANTLLGTTH